MKKGFTLIELLVAVAIIGVIAAVGVISFNKFIESSKIAATKENHINISNLTKTKLAQCRLSKTVDYLDTNGTKRTYNCRPSIDQFINYMNQTIYGMDLTSPFYPSQPPNGSWCRVNVTNCQPAGYMRGCPTNSAMSGYMSIFKLNNTTIRVCSNLGRSTGSTKYFQTDITYF